MKSKQKPGQKTQPYFFIQPFLILPFALCDVTEDVQKRAAAQALMFPDKRTIEIPAHLRDDHFTQKIFAEPAITVAGDTYEHEKIAAWLRIQNTNPLDEKEMTSKQLLPNKTKLKEVDQFLDRNPRLRNSGALYLPYSWVQALERACVEGKLNSIEGWCRRDQRLGSWRFDFEEKGYVGYSGKTMLHLACSLGTAEAVKHLLSLQEKRAEGLGLLLLLTKDRTGRLPIHYAMSPDRDPCIMRELAAEMGRHLADVPPVNLPTEPDEKQRQMTALHLAAMNNDIATLKILLERKADLTVKDHQGNTALHAAVACGASEVVELLIQAGASAESENDSDQTTEDIGVACQQSLTVEVLKKIIEQLSKQQHDELKLAGPVGMAVLQMQQMIMKLQTKIKTQDEKITKLQTKTSGQSKQIKKLKATIEDQKEIIEQQQIKLQGQQAGLKFTRKQLEQLIDDPLDRDIWQPQRRITSPGELRQMFIDELASYPLAQQANVILYDEKESKLEFKKSRSIDARALLQGQSISLFYHILSDGRLLCRLSDYSFAVLDVVSRKLTRLPGYHYGYIYLMNDRIVGENKTKQCVLWDIKKETCQELDIPYSSKDPAVGLPDGRVAFVEVKKDTQNIHIFDPIKNNYTTLASMTGIHDRIREFIVTADGRFLVGVVNGTKLQAWNVADGKSTVFAQLLNVPGSYGSSNYESVSLLLAMSEGYVTCVVTHQNPGAGKPAEYFIRTWNVVNGACVSNINLKKKNENLGGVAQLKKLSNELIASVTYPHEINTWNIHQGSCLSTLGVKEQISHLIPLSSNRLMWYEQERGRINIWDTAKGTQIYFLESHDDLSTSVLLPNGQLLSYKNDYLNFYNVGGHSIELNLKFRARLLEAVPQFIIKTDSVVVTTRLPCENELTALGAALQAICPDYVLTMAITAKSLTVSGIRKSALLVDLEGLCQAFSISREIAPPTHSLSSLIIKSSGLYASPQVISEDKVRPVATRSSTSSSSSSSSSSSISFSSQGSFRPLIHSAFKARLLRCPFATFDFAGRVLDFSEISIGLVGVEYSKQSEPVALTHQCSPFTAGNKKFRGAGLLRGFHFGEKYEASLAAIEKAIDFCPQKAEYYVNKGRALYALKKFSEAVSVLSYSHYI